MSIKEIREDFVRYSAKVSDLCRNLSFAGIGIIWIFKIENTTKIPQPLYLPLFLFIIVLGLDLLQYISQTAIWYVYYIVHKPKPSEGKTEGEKYVNEPECINIIPWLFWIGKLIVVIIAYWNLGRFVLSNI